MNRHTLRYVYLRARRLSLSRLAVYAMLVVFGAQAAFTFVCMTVCVVGAAVTRDWMLLQTAGEFAQSALFALLAFAAVLVLLAQDAP